MSQIYDQLGAQEDHVPVDDLAPYINNVPETASSFSPTDQARIDELDRVGKRNTVLVLGASAMLEAAAFYAKSKGHEVAGNQMLTGVAGLLSSSTLHIAGNRRRRNQIEKPYKTDRPQRALFRH